MQKESSPADYTEDKEDKIKSVIAASRLTSRWRETQGCKCKAQTEIRICPNHDGVHETLAEPDDDAPVDIVKNSFVDVPSRTGMRRGRKEEREKKEGKKVGFI